MITFARYYKIIVLNNHNYQKLYKMSKNLHFKSLLLLTAMLFGTGSAWAVEVTDVLNQAFTNNATSYYKPFSREATSGAIYVGQCAGSNESIQLRSDNNDSGIVTTKSGGKLKKIVVEWHGNTPDGRTLNVYGSHTAYTEENLYNSSMQGELIGTIVKGTTTELEITDEYEYVGLRSAYGVMYLKEICITWDNSGTPMPPIVPTIVATPTSLTGFTYIVNSGPSAAQSFTVSGENLTEDITVALDASSNYEISLTESSGYASSLTLNQSEGMVETTTIYVRLKAGLEVNDSYTGTITITSADAVESSISLTGSVTPPEAPNVIWDLSIDQTATATTDEMTWISDYALMAVNKAGSSTNANNFYPGKGQSYTYTMFYKSSNLSITPAMPYAITSVVFKASNNYALALKNSTWTNASATVSGTTVTVTPTDGSSAISAIIGAACGFTSVKVYYEQVNVSLTITPAGYATYCSPYALNFEGTGLTAYTASLSGSEVSFTAVTDVPANTGVLLKGPAGTYQIPIIASSTSYVTSALVGVTETKVVNGAGIFVLMNGEKGVGFYKTTAESFTVGANTAYIPAALPSTTRNFIAFDETTAIKAIESKQQSGEIYNLAGQRVKSAKKGLYIIDGKKVVIK